MSVEIENIDDREISEEIVNEHEDDEEINDVESVEESDEEEKPEGDDSELVERAKKYGHLSKEEWVAKGNDPDKYKTPEEFDKTGKVIEQIYSLKKKMEQRDREIQSLVEYQQRTSQREYERAKQELEARLAHSKDDMDMEGVSHYTKELYSLQANEQSSKVQQSQQAQQDAQTAFIERNQHWFNDRNPDLKNRAIEIDNELKGIYPNASYEELAKKIESRMQYEHPERVLGTSARGRPSIATSGTSSVNKMAASKSSATKTFQGLSQDLKDAYSAHARIRSSMGQELSKEEFIDRLKKDGEI